MSNLACKFLSLLLLLGIMAKAQQQPSVSCLQVDEVGNVSINWQPPADGPASFSHYEVLYSISPSISFTSIGNNLMPFALNSFTHSSNLALSNSYYYFVQSWYTDGTGGTYAISSDTLSTLYLEAEPAQNNCNNCDSAAFLQWNIPLLPLGTLTENLEFQIWTNYPTGNWQLLTTVGFGITEYLQYVFNCTPITMNFRIRMVTPDGCEFISNIDGDLFRDSVFPATGAIKKIEVDANGDGYLEWEHSSVGDIVGYKIYRCSNSGTVLIGVVDEVPWQFSDLLAVESAINRYAIAAYDYCGNTDTTSCRSSSLMTVTAYQVCDEGVSIEWSPYDGWSNTASYYIVYQGVGATDDYASAQLTPIDTVTALSYFDAALQFGGYNIYRVEAVDTLTGYRAFTNFGSTFVNDYGAPEYIEIQSASVLNHDSVEVKLIMQPTALSFRYELQRYEPVSQSWEEVIVQDVSAALEISFTDEGRATDVFYYTYRVLVYNSCGLVVDTTNIAKTILLDGEANQERLVNTLAWSPYEEWQQGVEIYEIYRKLKNSDYELIDAVNAGASLFYEDDVSELVETDGDFMYRIEAVEKNDGERDTFRSVSNEVNLSIDPIIWIPNSMVIGGYNELFYPVISFALVEEYHMVIFSRWGDLVFETRDVNEGWDGMMKGRTVQEGTYNYFITVKDGLGRAIDRFGHISVFNYD